METFWFGFFKNRRKEQKLRGRAQWEWSFRNWWEEQELKGGGPWYWQYWQLRSELSTRSVGELNIKHGFWQWKHRWSFVLGKVEQLALEEFDWRVVIEEEEVDKEVLDVSSIASSRAYEDWDWGGSADREWIASRRDFEGEAVMEELQLLGACSCYR